VTSAARRVHRLLDMVVEEVSLVDRAANNRRFLLVKRDDPMTKTKAALSARQKARGEAARKRSASDAPASPPAPPAAPATPAAPARPVASALPPDGIDKQASGPLGVALSALESLTEAVELLSTVADDESAADLPALAGELREAADAIASAAGLEPTGDDEGADDGGDGEGGDAGTGTVGTVIAAVRTTLADVQALLAGASRGEGEGAGPTDKAASAGSASAADLGAVATALKALTAAVTTQGERLSALEKRAGVPQSRPPEAPPRPPASAEVSWPLDLNRPLDRTSVDRAVSFHDV
jgi:hypothetical protein